MSDEIEITEEMRERHPDWDEKAWALHFRIKAKLQELAGGEKRMIDDGKNDPEYIKIEDRPWSLSHFEKWENELQDEERTLIYFRPRKTLATRLWALIEALGRTYTHGGY